MNPRKGPVCPQFPAICRIPGDIWSRGFLCCKPVDASLWPGGRGEESGYLCTDALTLRVPVALGFPTRQEQVYRSWNRTFALAEALARKPGTGDLVPPAQPGRPSE
jgi:hypothetical protein